LNISQLKLVPFTTIRFICRVLTSTDLYNNSSTTINGTCHQYRHCALQMGKSIQCGRVLLQQLPKLSFDNLLSAAAANNTTLLGNISHSWNMILYRLDIFLQVLALEHSTDYKIKFSKNRQFKLWFQISIMNKK